MSAATSTDPAHEEETACSATKAGSGSQGDGSIVCDPEEGEEHFRDWCIPRAASQDDGRHQRGNHSTSAPPTHIADRWPQPDGAALPERMPSAMKPDLQELNILLCQHGFQALPEQVRQEAHGCSQKHFMFTRANCLYSEHLR
jgi:hypothetical protein